MTAPALPQQPSKRVMFLRAIRRRCPVCGSGSLFSGWFRMKDHCPHCGIRMRRGEDGYTLGALWFNLLLSEHLPGRLRFDRVVRGVVARPPAMPKRILVARKPVTLRSISTAQSGSAFGWYDYGRREVQLWAGLSGTNLPIVALHEITHAVHHAYQLKPRDTHRNYQRAQLQGWLGIVRENPSAWRWLVWAMAMRPSELARQG